MAVDSGFISNLAYCEYKALLHAMNPSRPRTPLGRRIARSILSGSEPNGYTFKEIVVRGVVDGVEVVASPDIAVFRGEELAALVKARVRREARWSPTDFLQLGVAAALYDGAKRDPVLLALAIATSKEGLVEAVEAIKRTGYPKPAKGSGWVIATRIHDQEEAWKVITRAVGLVRGEIQPRPTPTPAKCGICEYSSQCPYAITK